MAVVLCTPVGYGTASTFDACCPELGSRLYSARWRPWTRREWSLWLVQQHACAFMARQGH